MLSDSLHKGTELSLVENHVHELTGALSRFLRLLLAVDRLALVFLLSLIRLPQTTFT